MKPSKLIGAETFKHEGRQYVCLTIKRWPYWFEIVRLKKGSVKVRALKHIHKDTLELIHERMKNKSAREGGRT